MNKPFSESDIVEAVNNFLGIAVKNHIRQGVAL
jgi:hypothetical protein